MNKLRIAQFFGVLLASAVIASPAMASTYMPTTFLGEEGEVSSPDAMGDMWLAGNAVRVKNIVMGELFAAGSSVEVDEPTERSVAVAASSVKLNGAGYNAYIAASEVTLRGVYTNSVYVAASKVTLDKDAQIMGDLYVGAAEVDLQGKVDGYVRAAVGTFDMSGAIGMSLTGEVTKIIGNEGASVGGDIDVKAVNAEIVDQGSIVVGGAIRVEDLPKPSITDRFAAMLTGLLGLLALIALVIWRMPKRSDELVEAVREEYGSYLGKGLAIALFSPLPIIILLLSGVASYIGLLLALIYVMAMVLATAQGYILLASYLAKRVMPMPNEFLLPMLLAIIVTVLALLPAIGFILGTVVVIGFSLPSFGAIVQHMLRKN